MTATVEEKLKENCFESYIPLFEENHLTDEMVLSSMTINDYESIGISNEDDRKKLVEIFSEKKEDFVERIQDGKEYYIKPSEPDVLYCKKCLKRVYEDATLCSNCNNSLVISTPPVNNYSSNNPENPEPDTSLYTKSKRNPLKAVIPLIFLAIFGFSIFKFTGFFVIQPVGFLPEGTTIWYFRTGTNMDFIESPDGLLLKTQGGVSLLGRAIAINSAMDVLDGKIIIKLPYQKWMYKISTNGVEFEK